MGNLANESKLGIYVKPRTAWHKADRARLPIPRATWTFFAPYMVHRSRQKPHAVHCRSRATPSPPSAIEPDTSLIRVVAAAPATSGGEQEELAARPVTKTRELAATLRAQSKVAREDDRAKEKNRAQVHFG